jgi:hypothetical protein
LSAELAVIAEFAGFVEAESVFPVGVESGVDREVHATAGQEAGATCSCSDQQPGAKQEIHSIPTGKRL